MLLCVTFLFNLMNYLRHHNSHSLELSNILKIPNCSTYLDLSVAQIRFLEFLPRHCPSTNLKFQSIYLHFLKTIQVSGLSTNFGNRCNGSACSCGEIASFHFSLSLLTLHFPLKTIKILLGGMTKEIPTFQG